MSKILRIYNKWLLDINELRLMWVSSKTEWTTIGKFGTWLKYALAVLIREWIHFDVYLWKRKVVFWTEDIQIRDRVFKKILIDYETTSITTNLWVEWEVSHWLREFIANAIDEWGFYEILEDRNEVFLWEDETTIIFDYEEIKDCLSNYDFDNWIKSTNWDNWKYYKQLKEPQPLKVFKEWFLVYQSDELSSFYYRIDNLKINESRLAEDISDVKRWIAAIQAKMTLDEVSLLLENRETRLWTFYDWDNLSEGWDDIKKEDVIWCWGYELDKVVEKHYFKNRWEKVELIFSWDTYVNQYDKLEEWIFLVTWLKQDWDYDFKTDIIYLNWDDKDIIDNEVIKEAKEYRKATLYAKENNLWTITDVVLHFWEKQKLIGNRKVKNLLIPSIDLSNTSWTGGRDTPWINTPITSLRN